jgi:hypothetical protein
MRQMMKRRLEDAGLPHLPLMTMSLCGRIMPIAIEAFA